MNENYLSWLTGQGAQDNTLGGAYTPYMPTQSQTLNQANQLLPSIGGNTGTFSLSNLANFDNLSSLAQGIGSIGQLYLGSQQLGLARDAFNQSKQAYQQNMANSIASYNTSLEDKIRGRSSNYAGKEADVQKYLSANKLSS